MNRLHLWYCRSARWRSHVDELLRWALEDVPLVGVDALELGGGPGLTTDWLRPRVGSLTAVEYDHADAHALAQRRADVAVHHADATALPFPDRSFDMVVCFTMLHHVPTAALQDRLFAEAHRVLRPGGIFAGSDSRWGPLFALAHVGDTMRTVDPAGLSGRLMTAGFAPVAVSTRRNAVRFRGTVPPG